MAKQLNHRQLVNFARKWLTARCSVVTTELASSGREEPDALGWRGLRTILIECKTSRADFLTDKKKPWRRMPERGIGNERYYFAQEGMLKEADLPAGWGLLEVTDRKTVRCSVKPTTLQKDHYAEVGVLLSLLRRIGMSSPQGVSIKAYTYETKNKATLGVAKEVSDGEAKEG